MPSIADRTVAPHGRGTTRTVVAIGIGVTAALAAMAMPAITIAFDPASLSVDVLLLSLAVFAMAAVGTVLAIRVPANAVGWLLLVAGFLLGVEFLALFYAQASERYAAGSWPGTLLAAWLYGNLLAVPVLIMVIGIPLIYPDGRLPSPRWRWLVAVFAVMLAGEVLKWFRVGLIADTDVQNPFGIAGIEPLLDVLALPPLQLAGPLVLGGGIASVVVRYRRGTSIERAQLKWLIAVTVMAVTAWTGVGMAGAVGATTVVTLGWYAGLLTLAALPLAIGIAVLKYRLYEIDRIIGRTIGWAFVTVVLVAVFACGMLVLQAALGVFTQRNTVAVAVSTLVVAALFQPLRRQIHGVVDRRFDRTKYDAQRTVDSFAIRVRDEVAMRAVIADIHETVATAVKPASLGLWLRDQVS